VRKERVLILFLLMVIVVGVVFFGLYVVAQKNLESAQDKLKAEVAEIEERYQQYVNSKTQPEGETISSLPASDDSGNKTGEDTIIALEQMHEKIRSLESIEREFEGFDAIFFAEKDWEFLPENLKQMVKDFYRDNHGLILEIRQLAATGGPFGKLDFSKGKEMEWPHLPKISNCRYLLSNDAFLAALSGNYEEAAKDYIAIMQFADGMSKEPLWASHFNKRTAVNSVFCGIAKHLSGERLSPDIVLEIIKHTSLLVGREALAESLKIDTIAAIINFDEIRSGDYDLSSSLALDGIDALFTQFYSSAFGRPFLLIDEQAYVDMEYRISEMIRLPYYQAKPQLDRINREIDGLPITSIISRMALPISAIRFPKEQAEHEARIGLLQVGLAVELHHGQHGVYPQTLDEIAPTLGGEVPLDPYTGEYFVYKPEEDNFLLYSARSTAVDDPSGAQFVCYTDRDGNLVWRGPEDWRESDTRSEAE